MPKDPCKGPQILQPVVDLNRCESKGDCLKVCPYEVFDLRRIADADRKQLSFIGKLKTLAHPQKAYVDDPTKCHGCGLCVPACPEKAIALQRFQS